MAFFQLSQGGFAAVTSVCLDTDELLRAIVETGDRLSEISARLQPTAAQSSQAAIDRLVRALMKAYRIAVFIRVDYDTANAFQDVENVVAAGLTKLYTYHSLTVKTGDPVIQHAEEEKSDTLSTKK